MKELKESYGCCGLFELVENAYANSPKSLLIEMMKNRTGQYLINPQIPLIDMFRFASILYTGVAEYGDSKMTTPHYMQDLTAYIEVNKLGEVTTIGPVFNPNSGNKILICVWNLDHKGLFQWWEENNPMKVVQVHAKAEVKAKVVEVPSSQATVPIPTCPPQSYSPFKNQNRLK